MDDEAFLALDAIRASGRADGPGQARWVEAFKTTRWVAQGEAGLKVTPEGRQALEEWSARRREVGATVPGNADKRPA